MRVPPHIESVGLFAQSFSESVTSGKLKGSHLFASVIHAMARIQAKKLANKFPALLSDAPRRAKCATAKLVPVRIHRCDTPD
jgi:hypothetical protein